MPQDNEDEDLYFIKDKNYKFVFCRSCGNEMLYSSLIICSDCLGDEVNLFHKAATKEEDNEYNDDIGSEWKEINDLLDHYNSKLDVHISGDILWIDNFEVPEGLRRHGTGTILLRAIENVARSNGIKRIRLWAADTGSGRSHHFWEKSCYGYDNDESDDETDWYMSKQL
jgi:GNAT superfamily N-acetyltransferase